MTHDMADFEWKSAILVHVTHVVRPGYVAYPCIATLCLLRAPYASATKPDYRGRWNPSTTTKPLNPGFLLATPPDRTPPKRWHHSPSADLLKTPARGQKTARFGVQLHLHVVTVHKPILLNNPLFLP